MNPRYGTLEDCRRFVAAAHDRGIKVITELAISHTSDQRERSVLDVMRFWLDLGVDGLRLDAIPHPETHSFIERLRAAIDEAYQDRILIAEANQPLDVIRSHFGPADECQMAFHFPLVHQLFLALARQDARPIVEVVTATANLPAGTQWATFLRNHDELSFSGVEDPELEELLVEYGPEPGMRLFSGVRRRLSPLLGRNRARVELAFAVLFSLPGSPVIYYGDEIGMGDDIKLPDRDGLRLPMRWQDVAQQELRPVLDIADRGDGAESLLAVVQRMIATRRAHPAFGRGSVTFLESGNPRILALTRRHKNEEILVLANLGATMQPVEIEALDVALELEAFEWTWLFREI